MRGQLTAIRLMLGAAVLTASGAVAVSSTADAQNLRPALREDAAPLPNVKSRTVPTSRPVAPPVADDPVAPTRLRPTSATEFPGEDAPAGDQDPDAAGLPSGVRPAVRDGDAAAQLEPEPITDGMMDEPEVYRNPDGQDPVLWDSRLPEDSDAFERPAAGYDAQAFGVELAPNDDRRPFYLFRFEPWDPRGIRLGSFTVFPQADIGAAWVSNLYRTKPARADQAIDLRPTLRAVSNWSTHALEFRATGGLTFFDEHPKEDDRAYSLEARGRLDVSRRTQIAGSVRRDVAQEVRGTLENRLRGTSRADISTDEARLQLDHRFNRLSLQLRGVAQQRLYEDTTAVDGSLQSNRDRNLRATEEALRLSWTFKPTLLGFAEAGINQRRFEAGSLVDGIKRDSDGERYRVGVGFGNTSQVLRGEVSIGYGRQTPLDMRLASIDGMILDANIAWRMNPFTALLLRGSTDVIETSSLRSSGGFTRRAQAEVRHAFMRPLIGTASAGFSATTYEGIVINENLTELGLGLEYYLGPEAVVFGRYQHTTLRTNSATGGYDADEVRVGLRIRR